MAAQRWLSSILEQILQTDCDEYAESLFKKPVNEAANELAVFSRFSYLCSCLTFTI